MQHQDSDQVQRLVGQCIQRKDLRAFDELVRLHQSGLRYSLRQLTGWDEELADDIAQETFVSAFRSIHSFRAGSKFSTWLYRIAYNQFVDNSRKRNRARVLDSDCLNESVPEPSENTAANQDFHRDLARAMLVLSEEQRTALHLTLHRQYTQAEVADIMGCPIGTIKSHILRGKEKLQEVLADWREEVST